MSQYYHSLTLQVAVAICSKFCISSVPTDDMRPFDDIIATDDDIVVYVDDYLTASPLNANSSEVDQTASSVSITNCVTSLLNLAALDAVRVANAATTSMSNFTFWASDLGNYDLCMGFPTYETNTPLQSYDYLRHCVAGSTQGSMTTSQSNPFAGICVPIACGPAVLREASLMLFVMGHLEAMAEAPAVASTMNSALGQETFSYFMKLSSILQYGNASEAGYSCGSNSHAMTIDRQACILCVCVLLLLTLLSTLYHMSATGRNGNDPWIVPESFVEIERSIIDAFSLIKNVPFIFDSSGVSERFAVLDGLRVLSILWIILSHTLALTTASGLLNPGYVFPPTGFLTNWTSQLFFSARFAVDTFFFISGFLVVSQLLKKLDPGMPATSKLPSPLVWIPMMYLHRLMRIIPLYAFCLLLWWKIGIMMGEGPLWYHWEAYTVQCENLWWTNLLFINNLVPYYLADTGECLYVSWYLANDMQFFMLSPIFVLLFLKNNWLGLSFTLLVSLLSSFAAFIGTFYNDWSAHSFDGLWVTDYTEAAYTKPQYRINSYLIGIASAMTWHLKMKHCPDFKLSAQVAMLLQAVSITGLLYLVYGAYSAYQLAPCEYYQSSTDEVPCGSNWSVTDRAYYIGFSRLVWSICIAIVVLLSGNNQGDMIQGFLSHPVWAPFAKLTFAVYLLHVTILNVWFYGKGQKLHFSQVDMYMSYAGVVFVSFVAALIVSVLVESPSAKFAKVIEGKLSQLFFSFSRGTEGKSAGGRTGRGPMLESTRLINIQEE